MSQADDVDISECCVCAKPLTSTNTATTECNHTFHFSCLAKWQRLDDTCPLCRKSLIGKEEKGEIQESAESKGAAPSFSVAVESKDVEDLDKDVRNLVLAEAAVESEDSSDVEVLDTGTRNIRIGAEIELLFPDPLVVPCKTIRPLKPLEARKGSKKRGSRKGSKKRGSRKGSSRKDLRKTRDRSRRRTKKGSKKAR